MCLWLSWIEQQFPKLSVAGSTPAKHIFSVEDVDGGLLKFCRMPRMISAFILFFYDICFPICGIVNE